MLFGGGVKVFSGHLFWLVKTISRLLGFGRKKKKKKPKAHPLLSKLIFLNISMYVRS